MMHNIANFIGLIGVFLVLVTFYLVQAQKWVTESMKYYFWNLIAGFLILFSLFFSWNFASVVMEIAWIAISGAGLFRLWKHKN